VTEFEFRLFSLTNEELLNLFERCGVPDVILVEMLYRGLRDEILVRCEDPNVRARVWFCFFINERFDDLDPSGEFVVDFSNDPDAFIASTFRDEELEEIRDLAAATVEAMTELGWRALTATLY
jgi:hypothetical protein